MKLVRQPPGTETMSFPNVWTCFQMDCNLSGPHFKFPVVLHWIQHVALHKASVA